jgi:hypothetical protein
MSIRPTISDYNAFERGLKIYCSFYLRNGVVFVPTMAKTLAGYYLMFEPVDVQPADSVDALHKILLAAMVRGNPIVTTPALPNFPRPVMERYCGMKSLSAFDRTAAYWSISQDADGFRIYEWQRSDRHRLGWGWEQIPESEIRLPASTTIEGATRRAAELALRTTEP